jgi:hypothetical protein
MGRGNGSFRLAAAVLAAGFPAWADVDVFGITKLMPSKTPALEWDALHWGQGATRTVSDWDPSDPTGWSRKRGDTQLMEVGGGMLRMGGVQPRIYFMGRTGNPVFFRDVEVTGYFRRVGGDGASNGGFMVGVRSGPEGHAGQPCSASTYYAGIRYPGTWIFDKELWHPNDSPGKSGRLFPGNMPAGRWFGMKYLAYNLPGNASVKLELYADTVSNGNPVNGGTWFKISEIIDAGAWSAPAGDCGYSPTTVVTQGGGAVFFRNTGAAEANYNMVTLREIAPGGVPAISGAPRNPALKANWVSDRAVRLHGASGSFRVTDISGRALGRAKCPGSGACEIVLSAAPNGVAILSRVGEEASAILIRPAL